MDLNRSAIKEAAEDVYYGQVVLIWARWFVILAAAILAIWGANSSGELTGRVLVLVALMGLNFFLHGRTMMDRPANSQLLIASSVIDLTIIDIIIATWQQDGFSSPYFVLYYPVIFAFALVFPPRLTALFALLAIGSYLIICLITGPSIFDVDNAKPMVERIITLGAIAGLGTYYWRIQRDRRRSDSRQSRQKSEALV
jgi:hypothetical protein